MCKNACKNACTHLGQIIIVMVFLVGIPLAAFFIAGVESAQYFMTGIAVGFGIALQPLFHHIINGIVFHLVRMDKEESVTIEKYTGKIEKVGLIHTFLKTRDKKLVMISNSKLEMHPIVVNKIPDEDSNDSQRKNSESQPLINAQSGIRPLRWTIE